LSMISAIFVFAFETAFGRVSKVRLAWKSIKLMFF
jgi:hypothetical protein